MLLIVNSLVIYIAQIFSVKSSASKLPATDPSDSGLCDSLHCHHHLLEK